MVQIGPQLIQPNKWTKWWREIIGGNIQLNFVRCERSFSETLRNRLKSFATFFAQEVQHGKCPALIEMTVCRVEQSSEDRAQRHGAAVCLHHLWSTVLAEMSPERTRGQSHRYSRGLQKLGSSL